MTTKCLTIEFSIFPNLIVMEFPTFLDNFHKFPTPSPTPIQNANFINIVVSASLKYDLIYLKNMVLSRTCRLIAAQQPFSMPTAPAERLQAHFNNKPGPCYEGNQEASQKQPQKSLQEQTLSTVKSQQNGPAEVQCEFSARVLG